MIISDKQISPPSLAWNFTFAKSLAQMNLQGSGVEKNFHEEMVLMHRVLFLL